MPSAYSDEEHNQYVTAGKPLPLSLFDKEKPWIRLVTHESADSYRRFQEFLGLPFRDRSMSKAAPKIGSNYQWLRRRYNVYQWRERARLYDAHVASIALEKQMNKQIDYALAASQKTQELVMVLADKMVEALKNDDDEKMAKLTKSLKPFLSMLVGYGSVGNFLLEAHKTFHGSTINTNVKGQLLHWGVQATSGAPKLADATTSILELGTASETS